MCSPLRTLRFCAVVNHSCIVWRGYKHRTWRVSHGIRRRAPSETRSVDIPRVSNQFPARVKLLCRPLNPRSPALDRRAKTKSTRIGTGAEVEDLADGTLFYALRFQVFPSRWTVVFFDVHV